MTVRNGARAVAVLALALGFASAAAAGPPRGSAPKAPTNLRITSSTATSVSLAWDASSSSSSSWYCVQSGGAGCFRVDPPRTAFTYPLLRPGTTYTFTVVVVSSNGNRSAPSNAVTFTTPPDTTPPSAPTLSTTSVVPTRISLTWTRSVDDTSQVSYTLLVDGSPYLGPQIGLNGVTVPYLQPSSTHTFEVISRDSFGNSAESNVLTVSTPAATDSTPPAAPSNLRFSPETSPPEAWLDWDAASDGAGDPPSQLLYEAYVNGVLASTGIGNVEDVVYCTASGPNTIAVRAIDTSGNASGFSNELIFTC